MIRYHMNVVALFSVLLIVVGLHPVHAAEPNGHDVFIDRGACPFECCTYQQWTANTEVLIWDKPKGTKLMTTLDQGDVVEGLTGEVHAIPAPATADHAIANTSIAAGESFYVLHYDGENEWKVWTKGGGFEDVDDDQAIIPHPKEEWWVEVKDKYGKTGWALSQDNFSHQDACE